MLSHGALLSCIGVFCPHREEEDREVAAAMRASMALRRQEERGAMQERSAPKHCREERTERTEPEEPRHRTGHIKPISQPPGEVVVSYRGMPLSEIISS